MFEPKDGAWVRYAGKYYRVKNGTLYLIDGQAVPDAFGYYRFFGGSNEFILDGCVTTVRKAVAAAKRARYIVLWFENRYYGGPEEGGWWYNAGYPEEVVAVLDDEEFDEQWLRMEARCEDRNVGRRPLGSVLSDGYYRVAQTREYPDPYPTERPVYC